MVRVHTHARTVDTDLLTFRIDSGAKFGNQLAIDLNATIGDDFLAFTARAEARLSEKFLQANAFIVMIVRLGGAREYAFGIVLPTWPDNTYRDCW